MKRPWLALWVVLAPFSADAQPEPGLVLKGGLDASTITRQYRVDRYGFTGGLGGYVQWDLNDRFALAVQMDLLYTPRGAEVVVEDELQGKLRQHYFDVVATTRPEVRFDPVSVYLLLGVNVNFLMNAKSENTTGMYQDVTSDLRRVDVALLAGAGVALQLPHEGLGPFRLGTVFLEARHDRGLIDVDPMNEGVKNRTTSLMLGLSFVFGSDVPATRSVAPPAQSAAAGAGSAQ